MPSLNSGDYIASAIESALSQPEGDFDLLVQDGCSNDGTEAVVAGFEDPRISLVRERDTSQADALNRAIARTHGDWIAWLNADDLLAPQAFTLVKAALDGDHDLIFGNFAYVDGEGRTTREIRVPPYLDRRRLLTHGCYAFSGSMLFRRTLFERFGPFDASLRYAMDYDFYLRIAPHVRTHHVPQLLAYFRDHPGSNTSTRAWGILRETTRVRRRHGALARSTLLPATLNQAKHAADLLTRSLRST